MTNNPKYETVTADQLKAGDKVRVTFDGVMTNNPIGGTFLNVAPCVGFSSSLSAATSIERLLPAATPLEVGDEVTFPDRWDGRSRGVVRYVEKGEAALSTSMGLEVIFVKMLERLNGPPIAQEGGE